ncbi:DNA polymerase III subunit delta' [Flavobacterium sp. LS1P28]|uniref:DNA polymerase III subunit delta n=1 Tax=Flavobacterium bomense TaxID=2497483 RepID=A0A3S0PYM8_9FLAO|nr:MULTISPECIES: DNA polymerase III subunit delta' [Flavobacterium]RTY70398.1 DNA polymerase III subunit delta' [Flavobacterium sp. LB2P53]RTY81305.1 DNA polymerase III subunit delta' [Flavobacterium sp. ZB4P23]RTY85205.1 DNA polymerase III subunit delta' [Flavobacterium sp. LS1P28]RTY92607.1 DNA polymerase III subunit delta' [Flavobacterium sp. RSP46]RTZ08055.1 DNA polymerase III subunit delta' [Flavobacterium bomense]
MQFSEILGQEHIKSHLTKSADLGRIPHAQLFVGPEGSGTLPMAIAYAQYIICSNQNGENSGSNEACNLKFQKTSHPDLHFIYPTVSTEEVKTKPKSIDFITEWRQFIEQNPYGSLFDWYQMLGVKNKQGEIRVDDAQEILKSLALKSYEGGYKIMIIWMADKLNIAASNKLLKLLEEPTDRTVFILISENEEDIIQTIRSRCQVLHFNGLSETVIAEALVSKENTDSKIALKIAHQAQGNFNKALQLIQPDSESVFFEKWFVDWVRAAFRAKGNAAAIQDLIQWSEQIAGLGRETQKKFLHFCIDMFRQALLLNYQTPSLVYMEPQVEKFKLENFAPFVNGNNINDIFKELSEAMYHIERNGNAKIILTDLSIKLTRLIHKK